MHSHWILSNKISLPSVAMSLFFYFLYYAIIIFSFVIHSIYFRLFFSVLRSYLILFLSWVISSIFLVSISILFSFDFWPYSFSAWLLFLCSVFFNFLIYIFFYYLMYPRPVSSSFIGWPYWIKVYVFILDCWWCRSVDETF